MLERYLKEKPWHSKGICRWLDHQNVEGSYELSEVVFRTIGTHYFINGSYVSNEEGYNKERAKYVKFLLENLKSGKVQFINNKWQIV